MREIFETAATVLILSVALLLTAIFLYDRSERNRAENPSYISEWREHNSHGIHLGAMNPEVVVTEFMDFTCPICQSFAAVTDSLLEAFPEHLAVVFHHFPLGNQPRSWTMAVAAECAHEQGYFHPMYKALLASDVPPDPNAQWYTRVVTLPDEEAFLACMDRPASSFHRIAQGRTIGEATGVRGTPTVWINGRITNARSLSAFIAEAAELGFDLR